MCTWKAFSIKLLWWFPLLTLIVFVNCWVDPAHLLSGERYERGIADLLLQGHNVAYISPNYNDRLVQKFYIEGLSKPKDIVVLGSSRSMQINPRWFSKGSFFNHSVVAGSLDDYMAIYQLYRQKHWHPSVVIFCLDSWNFYGNSHHGSPLTVALIKNYDTIAATLGIPSNPMISQWKVIKSRVERYAEIVSPNYFQESLMTLREEAMQGNSRHYFATSKTEDRYPVKLHDGRQTFGEIELTRHGSVSAVRSFAGNAAHLYRGYAKRIDSQDQRKFEALVRLMRNEGVKMILFLPPFHPEVYHVLSRTRDLEAHDRVESYLRNFASRERLLLIGSYNAATCGFDEADFYDDIHARAWALRRLFADKKVSLYLNHAL